MRTAVLVLLLASSTAHARPARVVAYVSYVANSETTPLVSWLPSSFGVRSRISKHFSLLMDFDFFRTDVAESQYGSPSGVVSARARRIFMAENAGLVAHLGDHLYALAGIGWALEGLQTRRSGDPWWDDGDASWRPRAFVGSGVELRHGRLGVDFEARAVAIGGSGPAPTTQMQMIAAPEVSHFSLQASIALVYFRP